MSTLAEEYPDIKSLDVQSPGFEASAVKQVVSDWITKYGDDLNAIVLADDSDQAIGCNRGLISSGREDIRYRSSWYFKTGRRADPERTAEIRKLSVMPRQMQVL